MRWATMLLGLLALAGCDGPPAPVVLTEPSVWSAHPADGVTMHVADDDGALRAEFVRAVADTLQQDDARQLRKLI